MLITLRRELLRENSFGLPHRKSFLHDGRAGRLDKPAVCHLYPMNARLSPVPTLVALMACALFPVVTSCRKAPASAGGESVKPAFVAPELLANSLAGLPGAVMESQAASPIHWQPWTAETMTRAKDASRLVFMVVAMPQQPAFQSVLSALAADGETLSALHQNYVPVLVDGDASREMGLLTADLCAEIKRPLQLPLFIWMTYEGNPVAWIPVTSPDAKGVRDLFAQSHNMVSKMWEDDPAYVLKNSSLDNNNRRERIQQRKISKVMSEQPATDVVRSLRQLASLYDPYSRSFDETGGLFPASALELLSVASSRPGLPADARARCLATTRELLADLLPSPMFDPLDGGVFSSRRGPSWALPTFVRDCQSQARVAVALIEAHRATGNPLALEKALAVIRFAENHYATPEGLFAVGLSPENKPEAWMWNVEEIRKELPAADADWWIQATGMKGLGNLPSEVDPRREFFRSNTLGLGRTLAEYADESKRPPGEFQSAFESSRSKLLDLRKRRLGNSPRDPVAHAGASFRMVSAFAAAFSITGDEAYRTKAVSLLSRCRETFASGPKLRLFAKAAPDSIGAGRAFLYALALQSVLDVAAITTDDRWLVWSEDLATTSAELFTGNGFLKECPDAARLIDLPVTDLVMLFDDSTAGLVSAAESRLAEIGRPLVKSFSELATPMPTYALDRPVLHTDLLQATLIRHYRLTLAIGPGISPELRSAVERLPARVVQRRPAKPGENVPSSSIRVLLPDGATLDVSSAETLRQAVLPPPAP